MRKDLLVLHEVKLDDDKFLREVERVNDAFQQVKYSIGDLNNNIVATDNYMEKYLPFKF